MKKLLMIGLIAGTMTLGLSGCGGNSTSSARVPNTVLDEFYDMYPTATDVKWEMKDGLYEADFEVGNNDMKAIFTPGGDVVRIDS